MLSRFGLNAKEQATYLALLPLGETTLTPIARAARLPVTTVQSIMARLVDDGLVAVAKRKSRHLYEAHDPVILRRLLERQIEEAAGIIPHLQKLRAEEGGSARIRVYYRERMTDVFHQALASKGKSIIEIVSARDLQDVLGEKFHFTRRRLKAGVKLKSLRVERHEIKKYSKEAHGRELREAKFLPRELDFRASLMCWDDTVAFFSAKNEGLAWTVESHSIAETVRQLFDLLWSVSRTMETA
ncbi:MAG: helix-turn-helix domain-containing protein [Patescibacteria group bacterium]